MIYRSPLPDVPIPEVALTEYLFEYATQWPEKAALIDGPSDRALTYAQLTAAVDRLAAGLAARGFSKGDVFAIYSPNIPEYAVAFFGVARAGGINTTINPLYTAPELRRQLFDAGARYLVTIPQFLDKAREAVEGTSVEEVFVFGEADGATSFGSLFGGGAPPEVEIDAKNDLVALPYSSGTTGLSKGVMLTHYNLVSNLAQTNAVEKVGQDEVLMGILPFYHIYGMTVVMCGALRVGATVVTMGLLAVPTMLRRGFPTNPPAVQD